MSVRGQDVGHVAGSAAPSVVVLDGLADIEPHRPMFAHWGRRVVATLLDSAVLALLTWIAFPVQPVAPPTALPLTGPSASVVTAGPTADVWTSSALVVGAVVVGLLMQGYLGSTPGKLVAGIALVRLDDHRPAGVLRVLGREVMHVIDLLLLVGYLRPLWHRRRETFADTIASTVVLQTRAPLPYVLDGPVVRRWRTRLGPGPTADDEARQPLAAWQQPAPPRWRVVATWLATAACTAGVVYAWGGESATGADSHASCTVTERGGGAVSLTRVDVEVRGAGTGTRLGVTRPLVSQAPGVVVGWQWNGERASDDDLRFRVAVRDASGTERRWQLTHEGDGLAVPPGQGLLDRPDAVLLPLDALAGLEGTVLVEADAVLNGSPVPGCTVETTLAPVG